jgi:hypothetical protein
VSVSPPTDELADKGVGPASWRCRAGGASTRSPVSTATRCFAARYPSVSIEAGATLGWANYVDESIGIDTFGQSAPAKAVLNYFGIVPGDGGGARRTRLK